MSGVCNALLIIYTQNLRFGTEQLTRVCKAMPPRKRRRTCAPRRAAAPPSPEHASPNPELPSNLLAEIAARTDAATVFRCAAACKQLRREILSPEFIRRVTQGGPDAVVPSNFLGVLGGSETSFSVVHPATAAAKSFATRHMAPFVSRIAAGPAGLLEEYGPMASRGGLVVLGRREINRRRWSQRRSDLCVYDPMAGSRAFFPAPPDVGKSPYHRVLGGGSVAVIDYSVLLTAAADGIACSFMLLAAGLDRSLDQSVRIRVQTLSSPDAAGGEGGKWGPLKSVEHHHQCPWWCMNFGSYCDAAVVLGGVVHWLMHAGASFVVDVGEYILTYDVSTGTAGSVDLPEHHQVANNLRGTTGSQSQLVASPDGKLSLVVTDKLVVSIWVLSEGGGSWARHAVVDMEASWTLPAWEDEHGLELVSFGDQRTGAVFLRFRGVQDVLYAIDMETKADFFQFFEEKTGIPYEVDLASRLSSMKAF
ncbi:unnamed protein product [Urochloa decumbens]|uniref:DUF7595 domain-containing protein n=1 Tax=Urochloa decumbens TaxID=240449 RepID=A0ABC8YNI5_9POAL